MAVRASVTVTISCYRDTESITRYYKLQSSTADPPGKPTVKPPSGWTDTEPAYSSGSTNTLYFVDLMVFSDGTWSYSEVSKSSSYEAAKEAYNKAQNAQDTANDANDKIDNLEIGGRNLLPNSKNLADFVVEKASAASWEVGEESSKLTRLTSGTYYGVYYFVNVEPSTTYTFSFEVVELSSTTSCQYAIGANSGWTDLVARTTITSTGKQIVTFTAGSSTTKIRLYFCITLQNAYMTLKNAQLEKGNKATDWTSAPEDIENKVDKVDDKIDKLEIGGRNLLLNTKTFDGVNDGMPKVSETYKDLTVRGAIIDSSVAVVCQYLNFTGFNLGDVYTFSFYAKGTVSQLHAFFYGETGYVKAKTIASNGASVTVDFGDGNTNFTISSEWNRYFVTWELESTGDITIGKHILLRTDGSTSGENVYICGCKLEKGDKATDWSPAIEDVESDISEASKTATNYMEFIENKGLIVGDMTGETLGKNVLIDDDSVDIRNGEATLASFAAGSKNETDEFGQSVTRDYANVTSMYNTEFGTHKALATEMNAHATTEHYAEHDFKSSSGHNYMAGVELHAGVSDPEYDPDAGETSYIDADIVVRAGKKSESDGGSGQYSIARMFAKTIYLNAKEQLRWEIPVITDFNCNVNGGSEIAYLGVDSTNRPTNMNGWLEVKNYRNDSGYLSQIYRTYKGQFYQRIKNAGMWSPWKAGLVNKHKLWIGTLSKGGSVTINDLDLYDVFMARTSQGAYMMLGVRYYNDSGDPEANVTFVGAYDNGTKSYVLKALCTMSGTTFTLTQCSAHELASSGVTGTALTIKSLWGIM